MVESDIFEQLTKVAPAARKHQQRPLLDQDFTFIGAKGGSYQILSAEFLGEGTESQVYQVQDLKTDQILTAKIDFNYAKWLETNPELAPNREKIVDFLARHHEHRNFHLLPLADVGEYPDPIHPKLKYPIYVHPYCPKGSLANDLRKHSLDDLRKFVIPALVQAIDTLHKANIIHVDIKPGNVYLYGTDYVIADFTSATIVDSESKFVTIHENDALGTLGYMAPEASRMYLSSASDMYSLGFTVATLYNARHPYQDFLERPGDLQVHMDRPEIEMSYASKTDRRILKPLLDALTRNEAGERPTVADVKLWLRDPQQFHAKFLPAAAGRPRAENQPIPVPTVAKASPASGVLKPGSVRSSQLPKWSRPIIFGNQPYFNEFDLARALQRDWERAKKHLYANNLLKIEPALNGAQREMILTIQTDPSTKNNPDLGLSKFIDYLLAGRIGYLWQGREYKTLEEIANRMPRESIEPLAQMLYSGYLTWKINQFVKMVRQPQQKQLLEQDFKKAARSELLAQRFPKLAAYYSKYAWVKTVKHNFKSPDQYFLGISSSSEKFYAEALRLDQNDQVLGELAALGYHEFVLSFKSQSPNNHARKLELVYDFFDNICSNSKKVREHYLSHGPNGSWFWLQNNLDLYSFNTIEAQTLRTRIAQVQLNTSLNLNQMRVNLTEIENYWSAFQNLFSGDAYLIVCLNQPLEKASQRPISSINVRTFFLEQHFSKTVPIGYKEFLFPKIYLSVNHPTPNAFAQACMFLSNQDWVQADARFNEAQKLGYDQGAIYAGKLLCELQINATSSHTPFQTSLVTTSSNYQSALKYGSAELKSALKNFAKEETQYLKYQAAFSKSQSDRTTEDIDATITLFSALEDYKDVADQIELLKKRKERVLRRNHLQEDWVQVSKWIGIIVGGILLGLIFTNFVPPLNQNPFGWVLEVIYYLGNALGIPHGQSGYFIEDWLNGINSSELRNFDSSGISLFDQTLSCMAFALWLAVMIYPRAKRADHKLMSLFENIMGSLSALAMTALSGWFGYALGFRAVPNDADMYFSSCILSAILVASHCIWSYNSISWVSKFLSVPLLYGALAQILVFGWYAGIGALNDTFSTGLIFDAGLYIIIAIYFIKVLLDRTPVIYSKNLRIATQTVAILTICLIGVSLFSPWISLA
ncbi:MAG: protein kinase [Bifidobacteriaceae bacterium]|jgi:serine/threonine protein kinase|nr:protein kinase [Bifidobacteriaceae bacterium]